MRPRLRASGRVQFGKPIAGFQLMQAKLAEIYTEIVKAQLLALRLGQLKDAGKVDFLARLDGQAQQRARTRWRPRASAARSSAPTGSPTSTRSMRHMVNLETVYTYEGTHDIHTLILGEELTGSAGLHMKHIVPQHRALRRRRRRGIVYYPRFFNYFHVAFEDFFTKNAGVPYDQILSKERVGFPTVHVETRLRHPAAPRRRHRRGDDGLARSASRASPPPTACCAPGKLCARAEITTATVDLDQMQAIPIPEKYRAALERSGSRHKRKGFHPLRLRGGCRAA